MSVQEEDLGGFCFDCAVSNPNHEPIQPELLYNPWPLLIRSKVLDYPRTQPLICTMYTATSLALLEKINQRRQRRTTRRKPNLEDRNDFYDWFIYLHEYAHHRYLYWTPAKEAAKIFLSLSYYYLDQLQLTSAADEIEGNWERFTNCTKILDKIEKKIGFVEELMATAMSINAMEFQTLPGGWWTGFQEELARLKERALANEEKSFPGFRAAYKRIEPVVKLMYGNYDLMGSMLPLIQPIFRFEDEEDEDEVLMAFDAYPHLEIVCEMILLGGKHLASQYLKETIESEEARIAMEGWETALTLQIDLIRDFEAARAENNLKSHPGIFMQKLLNLARGAFERRGDRLVINPVEHADHSRRTLQDFYTTFTTSPAGIMILQRDVRGARSFIDMYHYNMSDTPVPNDVIEDHTNLLFCEGIRQQVVARKGFICPFYKGQQHCQCKQVVRKMYQRLYDFASRGLFGWGGDWSLPPCFFLKR